MDPESDPFLEGHEEQTPNERLALRRDDSATNQPGWLLRVVPNRYPAVTTDAASSGTRLITQGISQPSALSQSMAVGLHEVVIECPDTRTRLIDLNATEVLRILYAWQSRIRTLHDHDAVQHVSVFRNEGAAAGASLAHCHSQILATGFVPEQVRARERLIHEHYLQSRSDLIGDLLRAECEQQTRIVRDNDAFVCLCPHASRVAWHVRWIPATTMPHDFAAMTEKHLAELACQLLSMAKAIGRLTDHAAMNVNLVLPSCDSVQANGYAHRWMLELLPRTSRFAGYELMTDVDIITTAPEDAAAQLRETVSEIALPDLDHSLHPQGFSWR
jgi:UDPglucose--hexose-1-phosphate uridylyltransferase